MRKTFLLQFISQECLLGVNPFRTQHAVRSWKFTVKFGVTLVALSWTVNSATREFQIAKIWLLIPRSFLNRAQGGGKRTKKTTRSPSPQNLCTTAGHKFTNTGHSRDEKQENMFVALWTYRKECIAHCFHSKWYTWYIFWTMRNQYKQVLTLA